MASSYTIDSLNGTSTPTGGQVPVTANSDGSVTSPYDSFTNTMLGLLQSVKDANTSGNAALAQQGQNLNQEAINAGNPNNQLGNASVFQGMTPSDRLAAEQALQNSYQPGSLSITNQQNANNQSTADETGIINADIAAQKPVAKGLGDDLVTPGGSIVSPAFNSTINPDTGLPYGYGDNTNSTPNNTSDGSTVVDGVQFGDMRASGGLGAYSTTQDPVEYAQSVSTTASAIKNLAAGQPVTAQTLDDYIQSSAGGKSPITGQMIMNAAQQYKDVDPTVLAGVLSHESSFGTAGKATTTNNPGNQMPGGVEATYPTMQQGVNATAKNLAARMQSTQPDTTNKSSGGAPLAASNTATLDAFKAQLPVTIQNGARQTVGGIKYIDLGDIGQDQSTQSTAEAQAALHGVKAFTADQAAGIQALDTIGQSLNAMTVLAQQQLLPADAGVGTAANFVKNGITGLLGTNPKLSDFSLNKDSAIKAVTALAGGTGSGLRLNTSTIDAAVNNLPTKYDSQQVALEKIDKTRDLLNIQLATAFGNPAIANGVTQYNGHTYNSGDTVVGAGGKIGVVQADGTIAPYTS